MYNTILYPTDGSEPAEVAAKHVQSLATQYTARVHILYIVDSDHNKSSMTLKKDDDGNWQTGMVSRGKGKDQGGMSSDKVDIIDVLQQEGKEIIQDVATELHDAGCKTTTACKIGKPHRVICSYAEDNELDLIVMGTHGRSGVNRQLIGSVAERVTRTSKTPVLTVRTPE